ncbi:MAG: hypothetical protein KJ770_05145 [Actinobacteria bacterium]|nr:hypothetical protein [Actinomycetota bacterium]
MNSKFDYVITVCDNAKESCPLFPGKAKTIHWNFEDPAEVEGSIDKKLFAFRKVRDKIEEKIKEFIENNK